MKFKKLHYLGAGHIPEYIYHLSEVEMLNSCILVSFNVKSQWVTAAVKGIVTEILINLQLLSISLSPLALNEFFLGSCNIYNTRVHLGTCILIILCELITYHLPNDNFKVPHKYS